MTTALQVYFHGLSLRLGYTPASHPSDRDIQPDGAEVTIDEVKVEDREEWEEHSRECGGHVPFTPDEIIDSLKRHDIDDLCTAAEEEYSR